MNVAFAIDELLRLTKQTPSGCREAVDFPLPSEHREFLKRCNGISVYDGAYRLFSYDVSNKYGLQAWNANESWIYAWKDSLKDFVFFGCTLFGDQFAYKRSELDNGQSKIYKLFSDDLYAEMISTDFVSFIQEEFTRLATHPYDDMAINAIAKYGQLSTSQLLIYSPPLGIGGSEDINSLICMESYEAMTLMGDLTTQLNDLPDNEIIHGIETYQDELHRTRIKVIHGNIINAFN